MQPAIHASDSISELISVKAAMHPDAPAILAPGREPMTYGLLWQQVQYVAVALSARGLMPSSRVAVVLPNGPEMATTFLGVSAYCTCAPLNPAYTAAEFRFFLEDARARAVILLKGDRGPAWSVAMDMGLEVLEIELDPARAAGQFAIDSSPRSTPPNGLRVAPENIALVLHTSGTTGRPKIVPLSHANLVASASSIARHLALGPTDRCLNVMPLFHIHGLVGALLATIAGGASIVCTPGFDDQAFFEWVAQLNPSWYSAVPTIHQAVIAESARYREVAPAHRFRFVRSSSAALAPTTCDALRELIGAPVVEAYGMTEASHEMASNPVSGRCKPGSVGRPTGAKIAIMGESGELLAVGATGEIVIRGPGVMAGYERNDEANLAAFSNGWFRTGDEGRFDDDGYLYISGRLKEIINRGGEKISPREIDEALLEHSEVEQAVAFGVPHPTLGENVAAAVVLRDGAHPDESALRAFVMERLAPFKVPSRIHFVASVPRGATGKIQRNQLHALLTKQVTVVDRPPVTDTEIAIAAIWKQLLNIEHAMTTDNFFDLGGTSLQAVRAVNEIEKNLGVRLDVRRLVSESLAQLASSVADNGPGTRRDVGKHWKWRPWRRRGESEVIDGGAKDVSAHGTEQVLTGHQAFAQAAAPEVTGSIAEVPTAKSLAATTTIEASIESIFCEVLGCGRAALDDNFFMLGGDSIKGTRVVARINARHGTQLSPVMLFRLPTVRGLAGEVAAAVRAHHQASDDLADEIARLSDEEVARLLAADDPQRT